MNKYMLKKSLIVFLMVLLGIFGLAVTSYAEKSQGEIFQLVGNVTVDTDQVVNGDVEAMAGAITVRGTVNGEVTATAGNVTIYGKVNGDVNCLAGNVYVKSGAVVTGSVTAMAGKVYKAQDGTITGSVVEMAKGHSRGAQSIYIAPHVPWFLLIWGCLTVLVSWLALGALVTLFFSKNVKRLGEIEAKRPAYYSLIGFAAFLLTPPALVILMITLVGIPVAIILGIVLFVAFVIGQLGVAYVIGQRIFEHFNWEKRPEILQVLTGITAMFLITLIPVIGWLFFFITACIGYGGALLNRFGIEKKEEE